MVLFFLIQVYLVTVVSAALFFCDEIVRIALRGSQRVPARDVSTASYFADAYQGILRWARPKSAARSWGAGVTMAISRGWILGTAVLTANFTIGIPRLDKKMNVGENRSETRAN